MDLPVLSASFCELACSSFEASVDSVLESESSKFEYNDSLGGILNLLCDKIMEMLSL
jgi:hypothetical protein